MYLDPGFLTNTFFKLKRSKWTLDSPHITHIALPVMQLVKTFALQAEGLVFKLDDDKLMFYIHVHCSSTVICSAGGVNVAGPRR